MAMIRAVTSPMMTKQSGILILSMDKRSRSLRGNTYSAVITDDVEVFHCQDAVGHRAPVTVCLIGFQCNPGNQDFRLRRNTTLIICSTLNNKINVHIIQDEVFQCGTGRKGMVRINSRTADISQRIEVDAFEIRAVCKQTVDGINIPKAAQVRRFQVAVTQEQRTQACDETFRDAAQIDIFFIKTCPYIITFLWAEQVKKCIRIAGNIHDVNFTVGFDLAL